MVPNVILARPHRQEEAVLIPKIPGVYAFVCHADRVIYIGSAGDMRRRFLSWRGALLRSNRSTRKIMRAAALAPFDGWVFAVLWSDPIVSRQGILERERQAIRLAVKLGTYTVLNTQTYPAR